MSCPVAISGAMAGSMRFVFQQGGPLAVVRRQSDGKSYRVQATPLSATLRRERGSIQRLDFHQRVGVRRPDLRPRRRRRKT